MKSQMNFAILYETNGRLHGEAYDINVDNPHNRTTLRNDFNYLAENFFQDSNYLKLGDGYPVFVDVLRWYTGDVNGVFDEIRNDLKERDFNLF